MTPDGEIETLAGQTRNCALRIDSLRKFEFNDPDRDGTQATLPMKIQQSDLLGLQQDLGSSFSVIPKLAQAVRAEQEKEPTSALALAKISHEHAERIIQFHSQGQSQNLCERSGQPK